MAKKSKTKTTTAPQFKRPLVVASIAILAILATSCLALASYTLNYRDHIYPHTRIGTVDFSGQTRQEAETTLAAALEKSGTRIEIRENGDTLADLTFDTLRLKYDSQATLDDLFAVGRQGSLSRNLQELARSIFGHNQLTARYALDSEKTRQAIEAVAKKVGTPSRDAKVVLNNDNTVGVEPEQVGKGIDTEMLYRQTLDGIGRLSPHIESQQTVLTPHVTKDQAEPAATQVRTILAAAPLTLVVDDAKITTNAREIFSWLTFELEATPAPTAPLATPSAVSYIQSAHAQDAKVLVAHFSRPKVTDYITQVSGTINREPQNAELSVDKGVVKVAKSDSDGKRVKTDEAVTLVISQLSTPSAEPQSTITIPTETIPAAIRASNIEALGIRELIGTATTDFKGSPANRVHNITTGANFLNGEIVPPGEEFSTVKALGQVDGSTGYLPELVIKGDRTTPEFGGGLCQVSTTLFRSALQAGLRITERQNHSYRVSYYEPPVGLDATIFLPKPDLKLLNTTPGHILIQNKIEGTKITFELYGTKDGRTSTVTDPVVTNITDPPAPIYADTDTLPKGETKQIERPHQGATAVATYTVYDKDGKEINKQVFKSVYKAWPARFLVGTKE